MRKSGEFIKYFNPETITVIDAGFVDNIDITFEAVRYGRNKTVRRYFKYTFYGGGFIMKFLQKLEKREHVEIVCTGDSITQWCYHTHGLQGYAGMFYDRLMKKYQTYDVFMFNTGRSGSNTNDLLERLDRDLIRFAPDFATVMIGMNDAAQGEAGLPGFRERLTAIVEKIINADIEFMLMTQNCLPINLPAVSGASNRAALPLYTEVIRDIASEYNVPLCDVYADFERRMNESYDSYWFLLDDPFHPNETGHSAIADLLCKAVEV